MSRSSGYRAGRNGQAHLHGTRRAVWKGVAAANRQPRTSSDGGSTTLSQPAGMSAVGRPRRSRRTAGTALLLVAVIVVFVYAVKGVRALMPHDHRTASQKMQAACDAWRRTGKVSKSTRDLADAADNAAPSLAYKHVSDAMWTVWQNGDGVTPSPGQQVGDYGPTTFADELTAACNAADAQRR